MADWFSLFTLFYDEVQEICPLQTLDIQ
jgi:hypothetical protein